MCQAETVVLLNHPLPGGGWVGLTRRLLAGSSQLDPTALEGGGGAFQRSKIKNRGGVPGAAAAPGGGPRQQFDGDRRALPLPS